MDASYEYRLDQAFFNIIMLKPELQRDLRRMWTNAALLNKQISQEQVTCRRLGKDTVQLKELNTKLGESLDQLESYLTFASLLT
jgi:hypothetical protein